MVEARACCPRDACYTHCARHLTPLYVPLSEPWRPVGDMQAVSCGARSRHYSRLLPASSSQPRSIFERAGSEPMGRVHIYIGILFAQYRRPLLTDLSTAPVMRRAQRRTAVWEGRGATELGSRSCFGGILQRKCFQRSIWITTSTSYYYSRGALYNKDTYVPGYLVHRLTCTAAVEHTAELHSRLRCG